MKLASGLVIALAGSLAGCAGHSVAPSLQGPVPLAVSENQSGEEFTIAVESFTQPLSSDRSDGVTFEQQVIILRPAGVRDDAPVFFFLGNETDHTPQRLVALYRNYGSPPDVIFITADHRGYGQSIPDIDQVRPTYITIRETLADYDRLIRHYKHRFQGDWTAGGCSYGGGLVINFAHDYPDNLKAILASSALVRFEFETPEYAGQAAANLGPVLAGRLGFHMAALKPDRLYDDKWVRRERLLGLVSGLSQQQELQPLKPLVEEMSLLPTDQFLARLEADLPPGLLDRLDDWAVKRVPRSQLSADELRTGKYNWHSWKYQQCTETGTFFTGGLFPHTRADHVADCRASFGEEPVQAAGNGWRLEPMLADLAMPAVLIAGGRDPWVHVGVRSGHGLPNVELIEFPDALHCPDVYGSEEGRIAFAKLRSAAGI